MNIRRITYSIAPALFERYPGYRRGLVLCTGVTNDVASDLLVQLLRDAEANLRTRLALESVAENAAINAWRDAFRAFGAKPSEYRSSIEALARRVLRGDQLPLINPLVDIGNTVSLEYLLPIGSHGLDELRGSRLELRFATGAEEFSPFGTDAIEHPVPGEVIFADGHSVLTRRWVWRQANHTLTLPQSRSVEFNVDGLPPSEEAVEKACERLGQLARDFCGAETTAYVLSESRPEVTFTI